VVDLSYPLIPAFAWLAAGSCKFVINSAKSKRLAFDLIGYGGMPSTHTSIVCAIAALIGFKEGVGNPAFGVAVTLAFIVIIDANGLRRQIGKQAQAINQLNANTSATPLRERMGHTRAEIAAGIVVGIGTAWLTNHLASYL
jgi:acid phosphatase family membrane protein YuiD